MSSSKPLRYPFPDLPEPGATLELAPGLRWLRMPLPMALDHINLYLLETDDGWWVIDTGMDTAETRANWGKIFDQELAGKPICAILCTHMHPDHIGMAGWLCEKWKSPLYMTLAEYFSARVFIQLSDLSAKGGEDEDSKETRRHILRFFHRAGLGAEYADGAPSERRDNRSRASFAGGFSNVSPLPKFYRRLQHGQSIEIGDRSWRVLCGGGHTPEHASLYCEREGWLLSGDQIIPRITSNVSVSPTEPEGNPLADWLDSLPQFGELPADTLVLPAHNTPFYGLRDRVEVLLEHHETHLDNLYQACAKPSTAVELLPVLFKRKLDNLQTFLALGECIAHLHLLLARGRVERRRRDDGVYLFRQASSTD